MADQTNASTNSPINSAKKALPLSSHERQHERFATVLTVLAVMILTLMALGAGVRTLNAGLSCPDWPLCFGKVIPDFHVGVWFEFVHRAYAGVVAIVFAGCLIYAFRAKGIPLAAKRAAILGTVVLTLQIVMGGLTVLLLVKAVVVTTHLMLATILFGAVMWMRFAVKPLVLKPIANIPTMLRVFTTALPWLVLAQIMLGGLVASTYSGSVCVDWPLCNGQWVPTWQGAIGLQIIHRFFAYFLAAIIPAYAIWMHWKRNEPWMTAQLLNLSRWNVAITLLQVVIGIVNLMLYIPPLVTVLHQSGAVILLAVNLRTLFVVRELSVAVSHSTPSTPLKTVYGA